MSGKKTILLIVILVCLTLLLTGVFVFFGGRESRQEDVRQPEIERTSLPVTEKEVQKLAESGAVEVMAPQLGMSEEEKELLAEAGYVPSARDVLLELQASLVTIEVLSVNNGVAELEISAPDLAALLVGALAEAEASGPDAVEQLELSMAEALKSGSYTEKISSVSLNCSRQEDGGLVFEESEEYLDALYGGLISLNQSYMDQIYGVVE